MCFLEGWLPLSGETENTLLPLFRDIHSVKRFPLDGKRWGELWGVHTTQQFNCKFSRSRNSQTHLPWALPASWVPAPESGSSRASARPRCTRLGVWGADGLEREDPAGLLLPTLPAERLPLTATFPVFPSLWNPLYKRDTTSRAPKAHPVHAGF